MNVLDEVAGEIIPNRRITADSFRLLTARLKKKSPVIAQVELQPESAILAPLEIIEETVVSAPAAEAEIAPPEVTGKKPWAWLAPEDPAEATVFDPLSETETPAQAMEEAEPAPEPEPWKELPFEELFAAPAALAAEPEKAVPEIAEGWVEPEPASVESEMVALEPAAILTEPEPAVVEAEAASPESEAVMAEPELPAIEPEAASPEPEAVMAEPELVAIEPEIAPAEITAVPAEPELSSAEPEIAPQPEPVVLEPEAAELEPAAVSPAQIIEKPAPHSEKPSLRRKAQPAGEKLNENFVPVSGMAVQGIGEVAKAIFTTPTAADRTAFLAEIAALVAADAAREKPQADSPVIIVETVSTPKPQVRRVEPADDPFAKLAVNGPATSESTDESDEDAGELARSLLDMMLSNPSAGQPQERALAADALLKLVPRIPLKSLVMVVDRVSIMESPPHLLVSKLIHDPRIEVAGPLLELCNHINDQVLSKVIATGQVSLLRLIARRRHISATLSDQLIEFDDPSVLLTLVRNSGAVFSHHAFPRLADHAQRHQALLAPLATRPDLPAPIAFELFWFVPAELRRYLLSRFLTDSETLTKILKITHAMGGGEQGTEARFPDREQIESFVEFLNAGKFPEASNLLAEITAIQPDSAARIIADANGEPLTIALKAVGTNRVRFGEIIEVLKASDFGIISSARSTAELQNIFDSMSFNKARVLLTYWDWAVMKSGPYAPAN